MCASVLYISPVNEAMVQPEQGIVGGGLDDGHGAVQEVVHQVVHVALTVDLLACLWADPSC